MTDMTVRQVLLALDEAEAKIRTIRDALRGRSPDSTVAGGGPGPIEPPPPFADDCDHFLNWVVDRVSTRRDS